MTIKQQGGIFGRNPTFNNVDVDGNLTVGGSTLPGVDNIAVLDTAQTFTAKQTLSKAGATFDIFNFEYPTAGDRITMGLDGYNSIMKLFSSNGSQSIQLSAGGANNSFFKGVNVELHNSNLVMATAGNGIDFSATSGTGTSELFDDYEEGTWTPAYSTSGGTITTANDGATYVKVGRIVHVQARIYTSSISTAGSGAVTITGLPFTSGTSGISESFWAVGRGIRWNSNPPLGIGVNQNSTSLILYSSGSTTGDDVATAATDLNTVAGSRNYLWICGSYTAS